MKLLKDFSYKLLRTFALTTGFCGFLLLYMGLKAIHGNTFFLIVSILMFILTAFFGYQSWQSYQKYPFMKIGKGEEFEALCEHCGEPLRATDTICPRCKTKRIE